MSFAVETEKLVNDLIQAEYKNACKKWGEKYNSIHEGYAVLKEEVEEVRADIDNLDTGLELLWLLIKHRQCDKEEMICNCNRKMQHVENAIKELAQVGAVLMKIKNTIEVEE